VVERAWVQAPATGSQGGEQSKPVEPVQITKVEIQEA